MRGLLRASVLDRWSLPAIGSLGLSVRLPERTPLQLNPQGSSAQGVLGLEFPSSLRGLTVLEQDSHSPTDQNDTARSAQIEHHRSGPGSHAVEAQPMSPFCNVGERVPFSAFPGTVVQPSSHLTTTGLRDSFPTREVRRYLSKSSSRLKSLLDRLFDERSKSICHRRKGEHLVRNPRSERLINQLLPSLGPVIRPYRPGQTKRSTARERRMHRSFPGGGVSFENGYPALRIHLDSSHR
ncbi:hypothetical protein V8F33_005278 [Rhypophila sp. PSN 637]